MRRPLARLTTALLAVVTLSAAFAAPAYADEEPPDPELTLPECPAFSGEPAAADEFEAYRLALACGVNVEVLSLKDIDRRVFATPAGTLDAQIHTEPYQVRDAAGAWTPIDPTLVAQPDGSATSAATVIGVRTGAGGDAPFVTATDPGGGVLALRWPLGALPAPTLSGAVATYPEVLPGVDLAVQAEGVGFSWLLILKTPEAGDNPALEQIEVGIETVGLTVTEDAESGLIEVLDTAGDVVFEAGQAIMWDSSTAGSSGASALSATTEEPATDPATDPGRIGDVDVEATGTGITLLPDAAMLADPAVTYPLYIDPPFTSTRKAWANVLDSRSGTGWTGDSNWPRSGGMRVGLDTWSTCGSGCGLWRSAITLNIGGLKGKYIASASVNMLQTHTGGCADQGLQLWRTGEISNGTSWKGVDWYYGSPLQSKTVPSSNQTGCSGKSNEWVAFDGSEIKKRVQSAADQKHSTISFGVRSSNEGTKDAWRRIKISSVALHVTYYVYPPTPDRMTVDGLGCDPTESGSPWVNESKPQFSARARSSESESVYLRFRVRKVASESNFYWYRTPEPVGSYATVTQRTTTALPDGSYKWQARSDARQTEAVNSGYTNYCYFKVDATKPTVPVLTGPTGAVTAGSNVKVNLSASDPLVGGFGSGMSHFEYSWTTDTYDQKVTSTGTASVTLSAAPAGRHVLYARAVDKAGNKSKGVALTFFAGSDIPATVMGAWRLGGDHFDDSPHGKHLKADGSDPAFVRDRVDPQNTVTEFDGNDCVTGPTAIRTDAAFTVSLSVRVDSAPGEYTKVLAQGNTSHSAYQIQYHQPTNQWSFSLIDSAGETYGWKSVSAVSPVALGKWVDIVATYDPDANVSRLYLNGVLAGELGVTFTPWNGIDRFSVGCLRTGTGVGHGLVGAVENLSVWQGLVSPTRIKLGVEMPVGEIAHWELRGDGTDESLFKRHLTLPDSVKRGFDPFGRPDGAMVLDGQSCATTSVPIVPGDEPFGIGAWVKPAQVTGERQVLFSQVDAQGDGFVAAITADGKWEFGPASGTGANASAIAPMSVPVDTPPSADWQYVHFEYDGAGRWQTSVGANLGPSFTGAAPGWADAPLTIGCGAAGQHFTGLLHDIEVRRGFTTGANLGTDPAELTSWWSLEGDGADESANGRDLAFTGYYEPADNRSNSPDKAVKFTGAGCAASAAPALNTDESFTVGAWVRLDSAATSQVIVSAAGTKNTGFRLAYHAERKTFEFTMTSIDEASGSGGVFHVAHGGPVAEIGKWYFVVGTFDLRKRKMRLYVDGVEAGTAQGPSSPWNATGPLLVGAAGTTTSRWNYLNGAVDDVVVWQGTVSDRSIANMFGTNEQVM